MCELRLYPRGFNCLRANYLHIGLTCCKSTEPAWHLVGVSLQITTATDRNNNMAQASTFFAWSCARRTIYVDLTTTQPPTQQPPTRLSLSTDWTRAACIANRRRRTCPPPPTPAVGGGGVLDWNSGQSGRGAGTNNQPHQRSGIQLSTRMVWCRA